MDGHRLLDLVLALAAGGLVLLVLQTNAADDSVPGRCYNRLGTEISCDLPAWPVAAAITVVVAAGLWILQAYLPDSRQE